MKKILIAARELRGGTEKGGPAVLEHGGELTAEVQKALGLDKDAVAALVAGGTLTEVSARETGAGDNAASTAATKRADDAEAALATAKTELATLKEQVTSLETQLEAAKKATAPKA